MLPELASSECREGGFLSGGIALVTKRLLGDYSELVSFFSTVLQVDSQAADQVLQIALIFARDFLVWLVEIASPLDGIVDMSRTELWKDRYLTFLQSECDFLRYGSGPGIPERLETF